MIVNDVARKAWKDLAEKIREPLREQMKRNGVGNLDTWIKKSLNSQDRKLQNG